MGEFCLPRRDAVPFIQDVLLRPMRLRDGDVNQPATSSLQWSQPSFGLSVPADATRPRLPSIREMLGEADPAEYNPGNAGPSPSTVADSPGPTTPGGQYTHLRHGSWPRMQSFDSLSAVSFDDRSAPLGRNDPADSPDLSRPIEAGCRLASPTQRRQGCCSPRRAWQPVLEEAWGAPSNHPSRGRAAEEPRVLTSTMRSPEHLLSQWRPLVAVRDRTREEELELAGAHHSTGERRQRIYAAQPENDGWVTTLAFREQTFRHDNCARVPQRPVVAQDVAFAEARAINHVAPARDTRSRSDAFASGFHHPPSHGHSRSASFLYDRPGEWLYDVHDERPYQVGASGPGNPFAHPNSYPGGGYVAPPPGYHLASHLDGGEGSGQLAEMAKRKKRGNLPPEAKKKMMAWFKAHLHHPYPDEETKKKWIAETGLSPEQISNYCINARRRDIKNMRHEAGLSPHTTSETALNGGVLNHRKRRSSDESSIDDQLLDTEPEKRRRRH